MSLTLVFKTDARQLLLTKAQRAIAEAQAEVRACVGVGAKTVAADRLRLWV